MAAFTWTETANGLLDLTDGQLEYSCLGPSPENKPTIILLHEGLGCVELWRDFPKSLAERSGLGVFAYSRKGYGKSSPCPLPRPLDYMTREAVDSLPRIINAIDSKSVILLGHSDGATIAAIYAGSVADHRVRGLVLMAPHFFTEREGLAAISNARADYDKGGLKSRLEKYHDNVECAFRGWNDAWLDPNFEEWNIADVIDYLRIPTLAIQGADDQYGTKAQILEIETRIYSPFESHILPDCKHAPHLEKSETTLTLINDFCSRLQRIEAAGVRVQ